MHTGLLIFVWMSGVITLQALSGIALALAVVTAGLLALAFAPARARRLIRRVRFLLLAIVVFFAGFTPGEALLVNWPELSPTREGVALAAQHGGRLLAVVCCVALLLERLSVDRLVSGLYALLRPVELVGLPAGRLALRLLLVLRYVESGPQQGWTGWLDEPGDATDEAIHVARDRFRPVDALVAGLAVGALVAALVAAGASR